MTPNGQGQSTGALAKAIDDTFGDFEIFKEVFNTAGKKRFGSGWAGLVLTQDGNLEITSTANQGRPWMEGNYPLYPATNFDLKMEAPALTFVVLHFCSEPI
ncbi:MAG: Fe-Mn family superoxide dismutase [Cyanobacteria bacterium P01_D01_bin.105]